MVLRIILLGSLFASAALGELNLTPIPAEYELDGARSPAVMFRDGTNSITYTPPAGWHRSGSTKLLRLEPPNSRFETAILETARLEEPISVTDDGIQAYTTLAISLAPAGATRIEVLQTALDPLKIGGHSTVEATLAYVAHGQRFTTSILFLTRGLEQLRFIVTGRSSEFGRIQAIFRHSLYSLQGF